MEVDHVADCLASSKLIDFEEVVEIALNPEKIYELIDNRPSVGIVNRDLLHGDILLRVGGALNNSELSEDSELELCVTASDLIVCPIESMRVNGKIIYLVNILAHAPTGYHRVLKTWNHHHQLSAKKKRIEGKLTNKWNKHVYSFIYSLWYDQCFRRDILKMSQEDYLAYLSDFFK